MSKQYQAAPLVDRCIARIIDSFLSCIPCYCCFKDGIRDGKSIGKGIMGLRVVNYQTGHGGTIGQSCMRNCCDLCTCVLLVTEGRRHIGDLIAGTIVIKDQ